MIDIVCCAQPLSVYIHLINNSIICLAITRSTETLAALSAFRKRAADARVAHTTYKNAPKSVDFEHYRSVLKNKDIVAEGEKLFKSFKPVDYDLSAQLKAIEAFEQKAVSRQQDNCWLSSLVSLLRTFHIALYHDCARKPGVFPLVSSTNRCPVSSSQLETSCNAFADLLYI